MPFLLIMEAMLHSALLGIIEIKAAENARVRIGEFHIFSQMCFYKLRHVQGEAHATRLMT